MFKEVHGAATGAITFDEFCTARAHHVLDGSCDAFDIFDADGNGSIDRGNFFHNTGSRSTAGRRGRGGKSAGPMFDMADTTMMCLS